MAVHKAVQEAMCKQTGLRMRLCVNSKAMQVKVQGEKESRNGTIVTKMEQ